MWPFNVIIVRACIRECGILCRYWGCRKSAILGDAWVHHLLPQLPKIATCDLKTSIQMDESTNHQGQNELYLYPRRILLSKRRWNPGRVEKSIKFRNLQPPPLNRTLWTAYPFTYKLSPERRNFPTNVEQAFRTGTDWKARQPTVTTSNVSFLVNSSIADYGLNHELLHFHYDLWLFKTVSGAITTGRQRLCSPLRVLWKRSRFHQNIGNGNIVTSWMLSLSMAHHPYSSLFLPTNGHSLSHLFCFERTNRERSNGTDHIRNVPHRACIGTDHTRLLMRLEWQEVGEQFIQLQQDSDLQQREHVFLPIWVPKSGNWPCSPVSLAETHCQNPPSFTSCRYTLVRTRPRLSSEFTPKIGQGCFASERK